MVDNSTPALGPLTAWTLTAGGQSNQTLTAEGANFPWGWAWIREPRLIATGNRFIRRPGAMGSGSFTIVRQQRQEPSGARLLQYNSALVAGQYVCVTADSSSLTATQLDPAKVLWWGWISAISYSQIQGSVDGIGTATALEVGHLLDQQQVTGWQRASYDGGYGDPISSPPTANIGDSASYVIGNAKLISKLGPNSLPGYAFCRLPEDCSVLPDNMWTRWRLLRHLALACVPSALPPLSIVCADGSATDGGGNFIVNPSGTSTIAGFLNDFNTPEVYDLRNLTLKGAIDLCVPQSRGFNWNLELVDTKGWQLVVYSHGASGGPGSIPVNSNNGGTSYTSGTGQSIGSDPLVSDVQVVNDSGAMPDEVWIEGSPVVFGNTVSFADSNLKEGWQRGSGNQEDLYRKAAQGASDYSTLSYSQQLERNAMVRSGPSLRDVYTRYGLYAYANGDVRAKTPPGDGSGGDMALCPQLEWDGTNLSIGGVSRCPYLPTATLLRTIPWPEGCKADGSDQRPTTTQYLPQFLKPKLFRYDSADTIFPWIDLESRNGRQGFPSMHLDVDDRGAAFRVVLSTPEYLAANHWIDAAGGTTSPAVSDISAEGGDITSAYAIDYTKLVATIAIESDQRVLVKVKRPGIVSDNQVRRRLILRDPALQCLVMIKGAIIGLKADGKPDTVTGAGVGTGKVNITGGPGGVVVRNDWPAAQKRANMAAAWVFRKRTSVKIQRAGPDVPPVYARIGFLITNLIEQSVDRIHTQVSLTVNTVVEEVTFDFTTRPRIEIATAMPGMIGFAPVQGGGGTTGGGSVSVALGGTVGQAVQTQQQISVGVNRDLQREPLIIPRSYPRNSVFTVKIDQGNTLTDGSKGIKWVGTPLTSLSSQYDPNVTTSFQDGIGRGTLYVDGAAQAGYVLVINDGRGGISGFDLLGDTIADTCVVGAPISMPTTGSNVLVYAPTTL